MKKLLQRSGQLFIYAALVLKFVGDPRLHPMEQLRIVLDAHREGQSQVYADLDDLYRQIILQDPKLDRVHAVIGTILLVFEPLSSMELEILLELEDGNADKTLQWLQSVLAIPSDEEQPIRLYHPSFHDFLTNKDRAGDLYLDPAVQHGRLARACSRIIQIGWPTWQTEEGVTNAHLRLFRYACTRWAYHLCRSDTSDPTLPQYLNNFLQSSIRKWFDALIRLELLNTLVMSVAEIFRSTLPANDHRLSRFLCYELDRLGVLISQRHEYIRYTVPLNIAEGLHEMAIGHYPERPRPSYFHFHLGSVRRRFYYWHRSRDHIVEAIKAYEAAIAELDHPPDRPLYLMELAICRRLLSRSGNDREAIQESISLLQEAFPCIPCESPNKSVCCNSLALSYLTLYGASAERSDLDHAISHLREATGMPVSCPSLTAVFTNNLASALQTRHEKYGDKPDLLAAIALFTAASHHNASPPSISFQAAWSRAKCVKMLNEQPALPLFQEALRMAQRIMWSALRDYAAQSLILDVITCAHMAASEALIAGDIWTAIECFEQGCSTYWVDGLTIRSLFFPVDAEVVRAKESAQALEVFGLPEPIGTISFDEDIITFPSDVVGQIKDYDTVMAPMLKQKATWKSKAEAACRSTGIFGQLDGRVVMINASPTSCDAILIQPNSEKLTSVVHLPIEYSTLYELATATRLEWGSTEDSKIKAICQNIWDGIALPVVTALQLTEADDPPRIWWCSPGPICDLPIHAAADYTADPPRYLTSYLVSSYIPFLSMYSEPVQQTRDLPPKVVFLQPPRSLFDRPAEKEIDSVRSTIPEQNFHLVPPATLPDIISELRNCTGIHITSRAEQRHTDPADCRYVLPGDVHLRLSDLLAETTVPPFAFLSAHPESNYYPKPTCRLPQDMLTVGFASTVAAYGPISDEEAPIVSSRFYSELLKLGGLDFRFAAKALHRTMIALRESGEVSRHIWYILYNVRVTKF
ncbi:hypothetical protein PTI98_008023 [Pleurotus ostreatus]|nr:hypothetical protein PTI98_008023 [Pleurotus ostreatus]